MVDTHGRPNGHIYRAKLIARTETMYAQNESAMATYEASDAVAAGRDHRTTRRASVTPTASPGTALWGRWTNAAAT